MGDTSSYKTDQPPQPNQQTLSRYLQWKFQDWLEQENILTEEKARFREE